MDNQKAIKMLTAKVECMQRETSGTDIDCNFRNCYKCDLNYEQGTIGNQIEALDMTISALQAQEAKRSNESSLTQKKLDTIQAQDVPDTNVGKMDGDELDEAIRHCDEIVQDITWFCNSPSKYIEQRRHESAVKLRQLASWLRELKERRNVMSVLIKDMEMPKNCWRCPLLIVDDNHNLKMKMCCITHTHAYDTEGRLSDCPLEVQDQNMELEDW